MVEALERHIFKRGHYFYFLQNTLKVFVSSTALKTKLFFVYIVFKINTH